MSFNGTNPVSVGDPTRKTDYDRAFDNTLALEDGTAELDAVDIVTGATTASGFHYGEAADEGAWLTSLLDTQLIISAGVEYTGGGWIARATEAGMINLGSTGIHFYFDTGETPGNAGTATQRMYMTSTMLNLKSLYLQQDEIADPDAPAANKMLMYARDNGGKTELVARFPTGAIQQIAIEP